MKNDAVLGVAREMREYISSTKDWHEEVWLNLAGVVNGWISQLESIGQTADDNTLLLAIRDAAVECRGWMNESEPMLAQLFASLEAYDLTQSE